MDAESRKLLLTIVRQSLATTQHLMEVAILATPTGEERNKLTEINMALMAAVALLK